MSKSISPILAIFFHSLICLYWLFKQGGAMRDSGRWRARQLWSEMKLGREGCHGDRSWLSPQDESFNEQVGKSNTIDNRLPETVSQPLLLQCHVGRLTVPQRSLSLACSEWTALVEGYVRVHGLKSPQESGAWTFPIVDTELSIGLLGEQICGLLEDWVQSSMSWELRTRGLGKSY